MERRFFICLLLFAALGSASSAVAADDCPLAAAASLERQAEDLRKVSEKAADAGACEEFFAANPEARPFSGQPVSLQDAIKLANENLPTQTACIKGLVTNWKDQAAELWDLLKNAGKEREAFLKSCEEDLTGACRKELIARAKGPEPDKLSTAELLERAEKREQALQRIKSQQLNSKTQGPDLAPIVATAWDKLKKFGVEIQCYSPAKQQELICYAAGYVIDPTLLVPGGKAAAAAARIRALAKLKDAATAEKVATRSAFDAAAEKLGFTPEVSILQNQSKNHLFVTDPTNGQIMAEAKYHPPSKADRVLDPGDVGVNARYQNKGVYKAVLEKMLKDHPETTRIKGELWFDNEKAVRQALAAGSNCLEAIMASPAYKVRASLGFSRILAYSCEGRPTFLVERP